MINKTRYLILLIFAIFTVTNAQNTVNITVNTKIGQKPISPALYGRNNCLKNNSTEAEKQFLRDAGVRLMRENGGNNGTKYNWREDLSSHPDWYNNVYDQYRDERAVIIEEDFNNVQGMFGFPTCGWAASSNDFNFKEWIDDKNHTRTTENLAGGGDINKYLVPWPADSIVGVLDHWFKEDGLGLSEENFTYWNLDNEPDIWEHTHDDIFPEHIHPEVVIDKYLAVARKIKSVNPNLKLCAPAITGEWHFWGWAKEDKLGMSWVEYFIKRFGEATTDDGVQLIDMIDLHFYFNYPQDAQSKTEFLQYHRVYYDETYAYPLANGIQLNTNPYGGWDSSLNKEYLLKRMDDWISEYFPENNTVTVGVSEAGLNNANNSNANYIASWYASQLGTFADQGTELFAPWYWHVGQWEVMNLFSNFHYDTRVLSNSSNELLVSAYSAINTAKDSLSVILVNRNESSSQSATLNLESGKFLSTSDISVQTLSNLPAEETFKSSSDNALKTSSTTIVDDSTITITLEPLSITRLGVPFKEADNVILPSDNFTIEVIGETCPNKNNGQIKITAAATYDYVTTINGIDYNFQNNLIVDDLSTGTHDICIVVNSIKFKQCYNIEIKEGTNIYGKVSVTNKKASINLTEGTAPYKIYINGSNTLTTMSSSIDLDVNHGDLVKIETSVACEGVLEKTINLYDELTVYPNPTDGKYELALPMELKKVMVELFSINSQLISSKTYEVRHGKVALSLENQPAGIYFVKVYLDEIQTIKILKQ